VLIVNGAQHGLAVAALATLQPGDAIAVDALTYPGLKVLAQALRLELVPLPAATDGPDLDALAKLRVTRRIKAIYTMPTLHNPLGWVTPQQSRQRLATIARTSHHRGRRVRVPGRTTTNPTGRARTRVDTLRLWAVQERGYRPSLRVRSIPQPNSRKHLSE
jgi:hypothetical protein